LIAATAAAAPAASAAANAADADGTGAVDDDNDDDNDNDDADGDDDDSDNDDDDDDDDDADADDKVDFWCCGSCDDSVAACGFSGPVDPPNPADPPPAGSSCGGRRGDSDGDNGGAKLFRIKRAGADDDDVAESAFDGTVGSGGGKAIRTAAEISVATIGIVLVDWNT
jgi:hypothetical protein